MKFVIFNTSNVSYIGTRYKDVVKLDYKYINEIEKEFHLKKVNQIRYTYIITLNNLSDLHRLSKLIDHEIIIVDKAGYGFNKNFPLELLEIYDDYRE